MKDLTPWLQSWLEEVTSILVWIWKTINQQSKNYYFVLLCVPSVDVKWFVIWRHLDFSSSALFRLLTLMGSPVCWTSLDPFCLLVVFPSLDNGSASFTDLHVHCPAPVLAALGAMQVFFCLFVCCLLMGLTQYEWMVRLVITNSRLSQLKELYACGLPVCLTWYEVSTVYLDCVPFTVFRPLRLEALCEEVLRCVSSFSKCSFAPFVMCLIYY